MWGGGVGVCVCVCGRGCFEKNRVKWCGGGVLKDSFIFKGWGAGAGQKMF